MTGLQILVIEPSEVECRDWGALWRIGGVVAVFLWLGIRECRRTERRFADAIKLT
jgi:hypothetical protein